MKRILTPAESIAEQKRAHPLLRPEISHDISMIVPGRRALGEAWVRVTIGHDADNMTVSSEAASAPADGKAIMAVSGEDAEAAHHILEAQMEKAKERAVAPQDLTPQERYEAVNRAWEDYVEQKLLALKGVSQFGAAVSTQRHRIAQNPATRPVMHKER